MTPWLDILKVQYPRQKRRWG